MMITANNDDNRVVDAARRRDAVISSGERYLLHATLTAAGYGSLADELAAGRVWQDLGVLGREPRIAIAAVILRRDE